MTAIYSKREKGGMYNSTIQLFQRDDRGAQTVSRDKTDHNALQSEELVQGLGWV